jgi:putative hydrolase of the HAD superfamily
VLLFDLGGVVVENVGFARLGELVPDRDTNALKDAWLASPAVRDFERGRIPPERFGERFVREWSLALSPEAFLGEFEGWVRDAYPGAEAALEALRRRYTVACLSNSNELHWSRRLARLSPRFDRMISSHETGVVKPDPESFHAALAVFGVEPGDVAFFDDSWRNVEVARELGLRAHWVCGWPDCEAVLRRMGVFDEI